jgi:hypothetical protein
MDDPAGHKSRLCRNHALGHTKVSPNLVIRPSEDWAVRYKHPCRLKTKVLVNPSKNGEKKEIIEGFDMRTR